MAECWEKGMGEETAWPPLVAEKGIGLGVPPAKCTGDECWEAWLVERETVCGGWGACTGVECWGAWPEKDTGVECCVA